jgi:hypothetical protein
MHATSVRPQTKFAAALVAAGVVSAASIVAVPEYHGLPAINTDVMNASVITDALYGLGNAVNAAASGVAFAFDGAFSLPFDGFTAIALAAQNPSLSPNLLSWLVQRYVNPSDNYPYWSYPWAIKTSSLEPLAGVLPFGLGASVVDGLNLFSNAINNALSGLPNPDLGVDATDAFWASDFGRTVVAVNRAVTAPVWMLYNTAYYLGYLPADLEATFESAIRNPSEIPGLVSNLVYGLLSPSYGLLGDLLENVSSPFTTLPGPIGDLATAVVEGITVGINNVLSLLPTPISPNPFPSIQSAQFAEQSVVSDSFEANSLPAPSLDAARVVTLSSADPVEKKLDATDSESQTPQGQGTVGTPSVGGDVDPDATPAAVTDSAGIKAVKAAIDKLKLGNKVKPGDKFDSQPKDEPVKGEPVKGGTTTPTPVDESVTAGDPAGPTAPQAGETEDSGSGAAGSGAAA